MAFSDKEIEQEILRLNIQIDPKNAISQLTKFQTTMSARMKKAENSVSRLDRGVKKFNFQVKVAKAQTKYVKDLALQYGEVGKSVQKAEKVISDLRGKMAGTSGKQKAQLVKQIAQTRRTLDIKGKKKAQEAISGKLDAARDAEKKGMDNLHKQASEMGDAIAEPFHAMLKKDGAGFAKSIGGGLLKGLSKVGDKGIAMQQKAALGGGGGIMKGLGSVMETFSKLGPMISIATSFFTGLVKVVLDLEASVKDYNKQLLSTMGTGNAFEKSLHNVEKASKSLDTTLQRARDSVKDSSNISWGISSEAALGFQQAMAAEGVSLDKLSAQTEKSTSYTKDHASAIQVAVAYSRAYGVSLNEISQLEGEMWTEMGMGADSIKESFSDISKAAADSGMEANKFFGVIRSFSSDMGLFALRMSEVTKVMGQLAKTMSPRAAQKFIGTLNQTFTGGLQDNLKHTVIAGSSDGGAANTALAQKDLAAKLANLPRDLKEIASEKAIEDLIEIIKNPKRSDRALPQWQSANGVSGAQAQEIQDLAQQVRLLAEGDEVSRASASRYYSLATKAAQLEQESFSMFGKRLEDLTRTDLLAVEGALGKSDQDVAEFRKFTQGVLTSQEELLKRVASGRHTDADKEVLKRMSLGTGGGADAAKIAREAFDKDIEENKGVAMKYFAALDRTQQEQLNSAAEQIDYQHEISDKQTSILDKIGMIMEVLTNKIYNALSGIWDTVKGIFNTILDLPGMGGKKEKAGLAQVAKQDPRLQQAIAGSGGNMNQASITAIQKVAVPTLEKIQKIVDKGKLKEAYEGLEKKLESTRDLGKRTEIGKQMDRIGPLLKALENTEYSLQRDQMAGKNEEVFKRINEITQALSNYEGTKGGAANPPPSAHAPEVKTAVAAEKQVEVQERAADHVEGMQRTLETGVKLDPATVRGPLADTMANSVYMGTAKALFEYYMYSGLDRNTVAAAMQNGVSPSAISGSMESGQAPGAALANLMGPNAAGGTVTGIMGRQAKVSRFPTPPQGEGWASVGRGESIIPAGGGGGTTRVELVLKQDLKRFIDARVVDGAAAHDRNKRLR